jgi:trimethylguanosine synthase
MWSFSVHHGVSYSYLQGSRPSKAVTGGIDYLNLSTTTKPNPTYSLETIQPIHGADLFALSSALTPNIAYYLPRNTDLHELSALARTLDVPMSDCAADGNGKMRQRGREWVEVEEEWVGEKVKAVTAYFGGLVTE